MNLTELPLFSTSDSSPQSFIGRSAFTLPPTHSYPANPNSSIEQALNSIFPKQAEENKVVRTRSVLGETARTLSNEQIETVIGQFQYLIDTWLDEYERNVFSGRTLKEVINEG